MLPQNMLFCALCGALYAKLRSKHAPECWRTCTARLALLAPISPFASRVFASITGKCIPGSTTCLTRARPHAHPEQPPRIQNTFHICCRVWPCRAARARPFRRVWHVRFLVAKASNEARIPLGNAFQYNSFNSSNFSKIPNASDSPCLGHVERAQKR
jgi:hypothetical protein